MRRILLVCLLLMACGQGPMQLEQYTGTEGLVMEFSENGPPEEIYERLPFPVVLSIHNQGASGVSYEELLFTFNVDPVYVQKESVLLNPEDGDPTGTLIYGKSLVYRDGERQLFSVPREESFVAKAVVGTREAPTTEIGVSACYAYSTVFSSTVCIDTDPYEQNLREQPCRAEDISLSGGQGAPVEITEIEVESIPTADPLYDDLVVPTFTIHIRNAGGGRLVGPATLPMESACFLLDVPRDQQGAVDIEATLLGEQLECNPSPVKLFEGEGQTRCRVSETSDMTLAGYQNYESILLVNLTYLYKDSISTEVTLKREGELEDTIPRSGKVTGYLYEGDEIVEKDGRKVTLCEHYSENPDAVPSDWLREYVQPGMSCACEVRDCSKRGISCMPKGLCPGNFICCKSADDDAGATTALGSGPADKVTIARTLEGAAAKHGIHPDILKAMAWQETRWDHGAVGDSGKATGVLQVHSGFHPDYDVERGKSDIDYHVDYAARFLKQKYNQYGNWFEAVMHYNGSNEQARRYAQSVMSYRESKPWNKYFED